MSYSGLFSRIWPFWATNYITAPNIYGYQNGTLILGTTLNPNPKASYVWEGGKACRKVTSAVVPVLSM